MRAVALVTGASAGIGAELARVFARHGHDVALVARRTDRLQALAAEIEVAGRPQPLVISCDLSEPGAAQTVGKALASADARVAILVNNAGFGLSGAIGSLAVRDQLRMVDLNVRAVLDLTLQFLPDLQAERGKILNVASIASFMPGPGMAVYYASKAFVSSLSRALSEELKTVGVTVSVLHPGVTQTEFHSRAGIDHPSRSAVTRGASALGVAEAGYAGLMAGRRSIVPGFGNKVSAKCLPLVPDTLVLSLIHRFQRNR